MPDWSELVADIAARSGVAFRPGARELLLKLQELQVPDEAVAFFREAEPAECAEIEGVRLWPIAEVLAENCDYVPGCYIIQYGYVVFATTLFGDAFCFDLNAAKGKEKTRVVLIAHDWDWDEITPEQINMLKKPAAQDWQAFLQAYWQGTLDITPNYEPFVSG